MLRASLSSNFFKKPGIHRHIRGASTSFWLSILPPAAPVLEHEDCCARAGRVSKQKKALRRQRAQVRSHYP